MTLWCSISRTVQTKAFVDHGGLPLWAAIIRLRSSLGTRAVHYIVSSLPSTSIWKYSHPIPLIVISSFKNSFWPRVLGHTFGGCKCRVVVDSMVSAMLLCLSQGRVRWTACLSARFGFNYTALRCLWSHHLLLWKWWGRWYRQVESP